ncbi:PREDICTED: probable 28S ribosomal protein S26, mitochondrial [Ceratosolen solmsi marchali]|uniref:Small ribosomal subunit protein mS26 n=1 Tax=Ceratosolen solmsi marchali TaxID=326594 RepID=A0AAJ7DVQ1_9HYME|nr:PREDICTED: probable 28S ribosomal protein S26, mitochondrial [Ceratosolen solmsi marchali]
MQTMKLISSNPLISSYANIFGFNNINFNNLQILRWKRKPIWLPKAKSKLFRLSERAVIPNDELLEIRRLYNNYRTYYRSVRKYFIQTTKELETRYESSFIQQMEDKDFDINFKINEEWNKNIANQREVRLQSEKETKKLKVLEALQRKQVREEQINFEVEKKIQELKKITHKFITRENIDVVLNEVLNTTIDYNKALDLQGNWIENENECTEIKNKADKQTK